LHAGLAQYALVNITDCSASLCIFGVCAWANQPADLRDWILESLNLQKKYGQYNTELLSQLLVAYFTEGDLIGFLMPESGKAQPGGAKSSPISKSMTRTTIPRDT
jgi:hypothetical protein